MPICKMASALFSIHYLIVWLIIGLEIDLSLAKELGQLNIILANSFFDVSNSSVHLLLYSGQQHYINTLVCTLILYCINYECYYMFSVITDERI